MLVGGPLAKEEGLAQASLHRGEALRTAEMQEALPPWIAGHAIHDVGSCPARPERERTGGQL